ncbi:MAG: hypothetical protein J7L88_06200, partial [Thermoplasmata archaeon]|nr:hypothetical protein [Thermoplasmata archaeon]
PGVRGPGSISFRYEIPTRNLPPGRHIIETKATDSSGQSSPIASTVIFMEPQEKSTAEGKGEIKGGLSLLLILFVAALLGGVIYLFRKK